MQGNDVEKFNGRGEFLLVLGADVNKETGADVCKAGEECQPGVAGVEPGQFVTPTYLAVDNSPGGGGDVYVGDPGDDLVSKFEPSGNIIHTWGVGGQLDG